MSSMTNKRKCECKGKYTECEKCGIGFDAVPSQVETVPVTLKKKHNESGECFWCKDGSCPSLKVEDTQPTGEWEKEFEKKLLHDWVNQIDLDDITSMKEFIRSLLLTQREKVIKEVEGMKTPESDEPSGCDCGGDTKSVINGTLDEVVAHLKSNLK